MNKYINNGKVYNFNNDREEKNYFFFFYFCRYRVLDIGRCKMVIIY